MTVTCPCGASYEVDKGLKGRRFRCDCGRILTVGSGGAYEPAPSSSDHEAASSEPDLDEDGRPWGGIVAVAAVAIWILAVVILPGESGTPTSTPTERAPASSSRAPEPAPERSTSSIPPACDTADLWRPPSSRELGEFESTGQGKLTIENGTDFDAVAVLERTSSGRPYRAIFVRSDEVGVFTRVADGRYRLRFQLGRDWLREGRFCRLRQTSQFAEAVDFETLEIGTTVYYDTMAVTLQPVRGGTARTVDVDPSEFELPAR